MGLARLAYRAIFAIAALLIVGGAVLAVDIWRYGGQSAAGPADAALVLGAAIIGRTPTPVLAERLSHAATLYNDGQVARIIVTGGRSPEDDITEAAASRDWLVAAGVPEAAILLEDNSRTTIENVQFAKVVLEQNGIASVLVVSDPLHMRRAMLIAGRAGIVAQPSPTPSTRYQSWQTQIPFVAREVWFMAQYWVTGA